MHLISRAPGQSSRSLLEGQMSRRTEMVFCCRATLHDQFRNLFNRSRARYSEAGRRCRLWELAGLWSVSNMCPASDTQSGKADRRGSAGFAQEPSVPCFRFPTTQLLLFGRGELLLDNITIACLGIDTLLDTRRVLPNFRDLIGSHGHRDAPA